MIANIVMCTVIPRGKL